ncbi:MAG TPA: PaaI family thioesterase [Bacteroidia bacterium]|nr:PaaI family thioesterase [Bacteroidia bacterium]
MEQNLLEKYIEHNHFGRMLGMDFKVISAGQVEYRMNVRTEHLATPHAAHGGVLASLVDASLGVAALSAVFEDQKVVSTVEFKLNFLAPVLKDDELLAKAKVLRKGKRLLFVECQVFCSSRQMELVAVANGSFNAYEATRAGY